MRTLYTVTLLVLGLGYLFALIYVFTTYAGRGGGSPYMLSYDDLVVAYAGSGKRSRLETALRGPMSTMLPHDEINPIVVWVQDGADRATYEKDIKPTLERRCMSCHDGSNPFSSWYFTKLFHPFAWMVMAAGALMAFCFAVMWVTTMYQLWFSRPPAPVIQRLGGDIPVDA